MDSAAGVVVMRICNVGAAIAVLVSVSFGATVDPPQRVKITKLDRSEVSGLLTSYSDDGFEVMDAKKNTQKVSWDELPPQTIFNLNVQLIRKGTGEDWFKLGKKLLTMPGGRAPAEQSFNRAVKLDPTLKEQIAAARKEASLAPPTARITTRNVNDIDTSIAPAPASQPGWLDPKDPNKKVVGPQNVGVVDPNAWAKQSPDQQKAATDKLKQFANDTQKKLDVPLQAFETQYFLFCTDIPSSDATKWAGLLDKMYARLAELFAIPKGENIWRGKALVFVFSRDEDYLKFEMKMHATMAAGTAGMCHTYGNGDVHIAFYRQPNDLDFAHVLVHESTHGFLHRYRSPNDIPSWANEGLAEVVASELVPRPGLTMSSTADAKSDLQARHSLEKFFDADHIVAWQYPVARTLTAFMIQQSKQGYVEFINGMKDGLRWDEALKQKYGVTTEQLVHAYGISMGVADLKFE
jgi:hypothetical protein